jgi:CRISPR/Cas system type I-B associated protein Csh2 (Cas7 group RAMP superfamily)
MGWVRQILYLFVAEALDECLKRKAGFATNGLKQVLRAEIYMDENDQKKREPEGSLNVRKLSWLKRDIVSSE